MQTASLLAIFFKSSEPGFCSCAKTLRSSTRAVISTQALATPTLRNVRRELRILFEQELDERIKALAVRRLE